MFKNIAIYREAYDKIMYYVHKTNFEISGFGNVKIIKGIPTVTDIYLLKQENSSSETEIEADSLCKVLYDHTESNVDGDLKFWWHSHVNMGVFWSGTDMTTIKSLTDNGWFIHGVFNKKNQSKIAFSSNEPFQLFIDDIEMEIIEEATNPSIISLNSQIDELYKQIDNVIKEECDSKYDELVTNKTCTFTSHNKTHVRRIDGTLYSLGERVVARCNTYYGKEGSIVKIGVWCITVKLDDDTNIYLFNDEVEKIEQSGNILPMDEHIEQMISGYEDLIDEGWNEAQIQCMHENGIWTLQELNDHIKDNPKFKPWEKLG